MVVQGKGTFKSSQPAKKTTTTPAAKPSSSGPHTLNNTSGRAQPNTNNRGGAHTLDDLPNNDPSPQQLSDDHSQNNIKAIPQFYGRRSRKGFSFAEMFFPYHKFLSLTTVILFINLLYFIAILIYAGVESPPVFSSSNRSGGPTALALSAMGAKNSFKIQEGHVWRLFTAIFMHTGILHIAMNSFFLARYGWLSEARFGTWWMLGLYIYSGIIGNCASTFLTPYTISCGASGALFGILLANLYFAIRYYHKLQNALMEIIFTIFIFAFNLLLGFLGTGGTDNWAHLFGGIAGILVSAAILPLSWRDDWTNIKRESTAKLVFKIFDVAFFILFIGLIWAVKF